MGKEILQFNNGMRPEGSRFNQQKGVTDWYEKNSYALKQIKNLGFNGNGDIKGKKILDVGCGKGDLVELLNERGANAVGLDLPDVIKRTREQVSKKFEGKFIAGDFIEKKPRESLLGESGFDYVIFHGFMDTRDDNNGGKEGVKNKVSTALKLIEPEGEIRIYPADSQEDWEDVLGEINSERQEPKIIFKFRKTKEREDFLDKQNEVLIIGGGRNRVNFQA